MNRTYTIIKDEVKLKDFIDWLPELKQNEKYYVSLFSRKKYCNDPDALKSDKTQLKRFLSNKELLYQKIKQLEIPVGYYRQDDNPVPEESLALYISLNPRDSIKATKKSLIEFAHKITEEYTGYNPQSLVLSNYQKSCGTKHFMDVDFDSVQFNDVKDRIDEAINPDCYSVLNTRGGFHLMINLKSIDSKFVKSWYKSITSIGGSDISGDNLIPVPGCVQGDFVPNIVK